jgi:hypothetical protein
MRAHHRSMYGHEVCGETLSPSPSAARLPSGSGFGPPAAGPRAGPPAPFKPRDAGLEPGGGGGDGGAIFLNFSTRRSEFVVHACCIHLFQVHLRAGQPELALDDKTLKGSNNLNELDCLTAMRWVSYSCARPCRSASLISTSFRR